MGKDQKIKRVLQQHQQQQGGGSNLVGKFTQSVRRIVQEVKEEGAPSGQSREEALDYYERLRSVRVRLDESYEMAKKALVTLHRKYHDSKTVRNVFTRYALLKSMIKEVVRLETQYWSLLELPKQEKQESVPAYVMRACLILERTLPQRGDAAKSNAEDEEVRRRERDRIDGLTTAQIEAENTQLTNDLYRLLKKYTTLRGIMKELKNDYNNSKYFPMVPRYTMLKDMIKDAMHDPEYMEVCHEANISAITTGAGNS